MQRTALDRFTADVLPWMIFAASCLFYVFAVSKGWDGNLREFGSFRQSQTALTARYLLKGGPWLAYETPVLGPPWSIPMEFPLYQWIVALAAKTGALPLEQSGRLISVLFFFLSIYPFCKILQSMRFSTPQVLLSASLYCVSPQYLYWSRTFMIETAALALGLYYVWLIIRYIEAERGANRTALMVGIAVTGGLAGIVKITSFLAFAAAGALFFFWRWMPAATQRPARDPGAYTALLQFFVFAAAVPFAALLAWTGYADAVKSLNPIGAGLTSAALSEWNYGTLQQKLDPATWKLFFTRTVTDVIGSPRVLAIAALGGMLCSRRRALAALCALALFILPLAIFTNLHVRHSYYACANGVLLIAAVGIVSADLWGAERMLKRIAGMLLLASAVWFSTQHYLENYRPLQGVPFAQVGVPANLSPMKQAMDRLFSPDDIIVVFEESWSSEIPYYLDRRALVLGCAYTDITGPAFEKAKRSLSDYRIGAAIFNTRSSKYSEPLVRSALSAFDISPENKKTYGYFTVYYTMRPQ